VRSDNVDIGASIARDRIKKSAVKRKLARAEQNPTWLDLGGQRGAQGDSSAAFGFTMTRFADSGRFSILLIEFSVSVLSPNRPKMQSAVTPSLEVFVKRISILTALMVFALCLSSLAQTTPSNSSIRTKKVAISGKISQDGKAIVADGKAWIVSNVERLQNHLGEHVTVKGFLDPVTNRLELLSMKILRNEVSASARLGDSAFRR
jgi:hypothetical protein